MLEADRVAAVPGREAAAESLGPFLVALLEPLCLDLDFLAGSAVPDLDDVVPSLVGLELPGGLGEGLPAPGADVCLPCVECPPDVPLDLVEDPPVGEGRERQKLAEGATEGAADAEIRPQPGVAFDDLAG